MRGTVPIPFPGTAEEAAANRATHRFFATYDEDYSDTRCDGCDCKPWHAAASYPCGAPIPRMEFDTERGDA